MHSPKRGIFYGQKGVLVELHRHRGVLSWIMQGLVFQNILEAGEASQRSDINMISPWSVLDTVQLLLLATTKGGQTQACLRRSPRNARP